MTSLHNQLQGLVKSTVDCYFSKVKETEKAWIDDNESATLIQAQFRMYRLYKYYNRNRQAAIKIQKNVRTYIAKDVAQHKLSLRQNQFNNNYFSQQARIIQAFYRGYIKRKYFHDFYARKKYITFLSNKNNAFKKELDEVIKNHLSIKNAEKEKNDEDARNQQCAKLEFLKLATNLHHLASTKIQPGIYKPPFVDPPKAFNIEVESHIKAAFKSSYKWAPPKSATHRSTSNNNQPASNFKIRPTTQHSKRIKL